MGGNELVVVVRGVSGVNAVRSVDQSGSQLVMSTCSESMPNILKVVELPVVALLDMKSTSLFVRQGYVQPIGGSDLVIRKAASRQ